jgi:hypothetical protein
MDVLDIRITQGFYLASAAPLIGLILIEAFPNGLSFFKEVDYVIDGL